MLAEVDSSSRWMGTTATLTELSRNFTQVKWPWCTTCARPLEISCIIKLQKTVEANFNILKVEVNLFGRIFLQMFSRYLRLIGWELWREYLKELESLQERRSLWDPTSISIPLTICCATNRTAETGMFPHPWLVDHFNFNFRALFHRHWNSKSYFWCHSSLVE